MDPSSRHLLLVGQGLGVGPLVALAEWAVGAGLAVTLLAGAADAAGLLPAAMIPAEVEYRTATGDGSLGQPRHGAGPAGAGPGDPPAALGRPGLRRRDRRPSTWPCATPSPPRASPASPASPRAW